jgi:hypothetical protein
MLTEGNHPRGTLFFLFQIYIRRIGNFSIVQNLIGSGNKLYNCKKKCPTAKNIVQLQKKLYNCKINGTSAKLYVGIRQKISTTAKKMAQLQKNWHNCKNKCTTAKTNAQLRNTFIAVVLLLIFSTLLCHLATAIMTKLPPHQQSRGVKFVIFREPSIIWEEICLCLTNLQYQILETPL